MVVALRLGLEFRFRKIREGTIELKRLCEGRVGKDRVRVAGDRARGIGSPPDFISCLPARLKCSLERGGDTVVGLYWHVAVKSFQKNLAYRAANVAGIATNLFFGAVYVLIYRALFPTGRRSAASRSRIR